MYEWMNEWMNEWINTIVVLLYAAQTPHPVFKYCRWQNCYWNDVNTETELKLFLKKSL